MKQSSRITHKFSSLRDVESHHSVTLAAPEGLEASTVKVTLTGQGDAAAVVTGGQEGPQKVTLNVAVTRTLLPGQVLQVNVT